MDTITFSYYSFIPKKSYKNIPLAQINSNFAKSQDNVFRTTYPTYIEKNQSRYHRPYMSLPCKSTRTPKYLLTLASFHRYKLQRTFRRRGGLNCFTLMCLSVGLLSVRNISVKFFSAINQSSQMLEIFTIMTTFFIFCLKNAVKDFSATINRSRLKFKHTLCLGLPYDGIHFFY